MKTLQQLRESNSRWSLNEFVRVLNGLLPQFLPVQKAHTRVREDITPRLVRYYTTQGMLDEPLKEGREARYTYRHLLQLLVVRRLLAEGYGASAIDNLATSKDNTELEALLQGGVQLALTAANPALGFLQQIKERQSLPISPAPTTAPAKSTHAETVAYPQAATSNWTRMEILPGLEIHIREDFNYPHSPQEQHNLLQYMAQQLLTFSTNRRSKR
ncbi:MAG: MerR family transcriptional regulator [Symploca sp. SIO2G7]|nr:MerR family transcriptional regulator [Symploca sp. SIO2G7]